MNRKLLFLPLLLLFISCTVTKRVHRPGFHIQWHKAQKTSDAHDKKSEHIEAKADNSEKSELINRSNSILFADTSNITEIQAKSELTSIDSPAKSILSERVLLKLTQRSTPIAASIQTDQKISKATKKQSKRPLFWRLSSEDLKKIGVVLMSLGAIILLGSLLVSTGAFSGNGGSSPNDNSGGNSGVWLNFFLDLIGASGWFWLLVFVLIFVLVAYLAFLFVRHVLGGPIAGLIVGLAVVGLGLFFYILGKTREIEA